MKQDYLLTYNPNNVEAHPDSSDFESSVTHLPDIKNRPGCHRLVKSPFGSKASNIYNDKVESACKYLENDFNINYPKKECEANSSLPSQTKNKSCGYFNRRNPPVKRPSRLYVLRQKILPRFSTRGIFSQSANDKPVVKLQERKQAYTNCQKCQTCLRKNYKKPYARRESTKVQPVYAFEAGVQLPQVFLHNDGPNNTYSFTSTSDSGNPKKLKRRNSKIKKRFTAEMMREHWNYTHAQKKKHPNTPTADNSPVLQIFNSLTQCHQSRLASSISDYSYIAQMPSSGFWDFLFDKIHTKYQIHKCEIKPCTCGDSMKAKLSLCCCDPKSPCYSLRTKSNQYPSQPNLPQNTQCPANQDYHGSTYSKNSKTSAPKPIVECKCKSPTKKISKSPCPSPKSPAGSPKGSHKRTPQDCPPKRLPECVPKCIPDCNQKLPPKGSPKCQTSPPIGDDSNPCQEDHDLIKNMLSKKYNGEILCIHNPPCILINGCLNIPAAVEKTNNSFWPVLFKNIPNMKHKVRKLKRDKSSDQCVSSCEVQQGHLPEFIKEQKMQCLFSHVPPSEEVRNCDKKKNDLSLDDSYNQNPMCKKHPICIVNSSPWGSLRNYECDYFPKHQKLPNNELLNDTESFGAQAQQDTSRACRHNPPCIRVPKCMKGISVLNNYVQYDTIPDCIHSPICETVPACCRNNPKEMVSVSSQYPNSCRIV